MLVASMFPKKWDIKPLGECVDFLDHLRKPVTSCDRVKGDYPYYGANGIQGTINDFIFDDSLILLAEDGGHFCNFNRTIAYIVKGKFWVNNHAHVLKPKAGVDLEYLCRVLEKYDVSRYIKGATRAKLSKTDASRMLIPLPPLETQKQIAQVLATADQLRKDCQQVEQELNALAQSVFLEMFGDPVTNSKAWKVKELSEVSESQLGKMLSSAAKQNINPKKYLRNANIRWGYCDLKKVLEMDFNNKDKKKFSLLYGDLLVCEGGDVGRCAIWKNDLDDCYYQKALHRVRVNHGILTSEYLQQYFYWMSKLGALLSSTSTVTFSHLTAEKLKKLRIPIPPFFLQKQFSEQIQKLEQHKQQNKEKSRYLDNLFNSLLQKAFKGELNLKATS